MERYYYKKIKGKGIMNLRKPTDKEGYIQITKEEYEEIVKSNREKREPTETQKVINEAKAYLKNTDYIVLKIAEAQMEYDVTKVEELKQTYSTELVKRKEMRDLINNLQIS